jgi:hypothetical protein
LTIQPPSTSDFSLSATPNFLSLTLPSSGTASKDSTIKVTSVNGFSSQVSLSASWIGNAPSGVTYSFSKNTVTPPSNGQDSSTLTITASSSASTGSFTLRVTGTSSSLTHTVDITVTFSTTPPPPSTRGTLVVYIYNVNDKLANYMSGKTDVYLTGDGGAFSATMNNQGYATFSDIPVGTYRLLVFHKPQEAGALNLDEYWGTENVQVNQGYNERKFIRSAPWVVDYSVKVDGKEIARPGFISQEAIDVGSTVDFQISVKNSGSSSANTKVRLIIDANQISPFDYDQTSSWKTTSPSSSAIHQFTASFVAGSQFHEIAPIYSAYIVVYSIYDNKEYVTDQYTWTEFVSFKVQFSSEKSRYNYATC